jgi:hypothetical protein
VNVAMVSKNNRAAALKSLCVIKNVASYTLHRFLLSQSPPSSIKLVIRSAH